MTLRSTLRIAHLSLGYLHWNWITNPNKNYKDLSLSANKSTQRYGKIPNKLFFGGWIDRSPQNFLANHLVPPEYRGPPTFFSKSQVPPWKPTFLKIRSPQNHGGGWYHDIHIPYTHTLTLLIHIHTHTHKRNKQARSGPARVDKMNLETKIIWRQV